MTSIVARIFARFWVLGFGLILMASPGAHAGAWLMPAGDSLLIAKYETASADRAFDAKGRKATLSNWAARDLSVFAEHGLNSRVTLYAKANIQSLKTPVDRYDGFGSLEIGGRVGLWKSDWRSLAIGAGIEGLGHGRRSESDTARSKATDKEIRLYGGQAFRLKGMEGFVDLQAARRFRGAEADQWRVDVSFGLKPNAQWLIMAQTWAGKTDRASWGRAVWVNQEISVARHFGPKQALSLQLGVRQTIYGENMPRVRAISLSVWKRF